MKYVLYDEDPDGLSAAFAAWLKYGEDAKYIPVQRGEDPPDMPDADEVSILDFNYPRETTKALQRKYPIVRTIDHHVTAMQELSGLPNCFFDPNYSAAVLAWQYFHPDQNIPMFMGFTCDADLWKWELPDSKEIHEAIMSYPLTLETWSAISGITVPERNVFREVDCLRHLAMEGTICLRYAREEVKRVLENAREATFITGSNPRILFDTDAPTTGKGTYRVPVINATSLQSEVCNDLLTRYPNAKFAAYYYDAPNSIRRWGLRSRPDFDCSQIAVYFGGGGHKQAAGFATSIEADPFKLKEPELAAAM